MNNEAQELPTVYVVYGNFYGWEDDDCNGGSVEGVFTTEEQAIKFLHELQPSVEGMRKIPQGNSQWSVLYTDDNGAYDNYRIVNKVLNIM